VIFAEKWKSAHFPDFLWNPSNPDPLYLTYLYHDFAVRGTLYKAFNTSREIQIIDGHTFAGKSGVNAQSALYFFINFSNTQKHLKIIVHKFPAASSLFVVWQCAHTQIIKNTCFDELRPPSAGGSKARTHSQRIRHSRFFCHRSRATKHQLYGWLCAGCEELTFVRNTAATQFEKSTHRFYFGNLLSLYLSSTQGTQTKNYEKCETKTPLKRIWGSCPWFFSNQASFEGPVPRLWIR
jgi:hypothetical protein